MNQRNTDAAAHSLVEPAPAPAGPGPAPPVAAPAPVLGRRWADGAVGLAPADPGTPWSMAQQWPHLVAAMSEQAVDTSNLLLRALDYLVDAGRLHRSETKVLCDAMQQLRATSLRAQQITRLAGGRIRQARERVDLAELVQHVLQERAPELAAAGVRVTTHLQPVDVLLDPPVAVSLLNTTLDWGCGLGGHLHVSVVPTEWPGPAQLRVRVAIAPAGAEAAGAVGPRPSRPRGRRLNDGLHWMLLRQIAASSSLEVTRSSDEDGALLTIDFPKTFQSTEGLACLELTGQESTGQRETWVLVIAADAAIRSDAQEALRRMGIQTAVARDAAQARALCAQARPHVLVTAFDVPPEDVAALRREVLGGEERCPLVEITRDLPSFHLSGFDRFETPKVGREQLAAELPPTVLFELVKIV